MCAFEPVRLDTRTQEHKIHRMLGLTTYYNYEKIRSEIASVSENLTTHVLTYQPDKVDRELSTFSRLLAL